MFENWYWRNGGPSEMYLDDGHYFIVYATWGYHDFTSKFSVFGGKVWWENTEFFFKVHPRIYFGNEVGISSSPDLDETWFSVSGCAIEVSGTSVGPIEDWKDKDGDGCEFWDDTASLDAEGLTCEDAVDYETGGEDATSQCCLCSGSTVHSSWVSGWRYDYDYVPLPSGRYNVWYEAEGYESYWHSLVVNEYDDYTGTRYMYSSIWVEALNAHELVFVMHWRYQCSGGEATCDTVQEPPYGQGADEIDTLIMPDNDGWTPKGAESTAKYAFWDSSELEKGNGAYIGFDSGSATGGYAESTYFRNLKDSDSFERERFGMWVSAYSNGPFAPAQASVYIFCGLNACLTGKDGVAVRGFYYSATLGSYDGKYWWNPGRLVREADADGAVYWEDCEDNCYFGDDESPYLYDNSALLRVNENALVFPGITGVGSLAAPKREDVTMFFWNMQDAEYYWPGTQGQGVALGSEGAALLSRLTSGEWRIEFRAIGYYTAFEEMTLTGGQTYDMRTAVFVGELTKGQVRFIMTWKYECPNGASTCEEPTKPYKSKSCTSDDPLDECDVWGADEVDTLIMPSEDSWQPDSSSATSKQRYAFWESPKISSGGAKIGFDDSTATGGYAETTLFERLHLASNPEMSFQCWVNAYSGGPLSPGQVTVYVYCGPETCEETYGTGRAIQAGLVAEISQPGTEENEIYWWSVGSVRSSQGGLVSWSTCEDGQCSATSQTRCCWQDDLALAPYLYGKESNMRVSESLLLLGSITGVSVSPAASTVDYKVEETDGPGGKVSGIATALKGFAQGAVWKATGGIRVQGAWGDFQGTYKITYSSVGFMDYFEFVQVSGGETRQLSNVIFVKELLKGQVQVVLQWQFVCEPAAPKCEEPLRPFFSPTCTNPGCPRTGAGEVDTLIMPSTSEWVSSVYPEAESVGYAYWSDPNITSGGATIGFDEDYATGGYYETTIFKNLDQAVSPVQSFSVWVHAYSGQDGCRLAAWADPDLVPKDEDYVPICSDYALSLLQTQVLVFCGPDTCVDEKGQAISGMIGVALQPQVNGIFWWNSGHIGVNAAKKVTWTKCGGVKDEDIASCYTTTDTESPYKFGSEAGGRIEEFRRRRLPLRRRQGT